MIPRMIPYIIVVYALIYRCRPNPFNLPALRKSFANPRCDLFVRSLNAQLKRYSYLRSVTIEQVERDRPDCIFGGKRKGYFKCSALCRVELLRIFALARARGEFFARWVNPATGEKYDGTEYFAHFCTLEYVHAHKPAMTIGFRKDGSLRSTSQIYKRILR